MALLRATVRLLRMATRRKGPGMATRHHNKATRRPASASRRRASRATRLCRKVVLRRAGRLRATAVRLKAVRRLTLRIHSSRRRRPIRLTRSRAGRALPRTLRTLSSKRRRRNSTVGHRRPRASTAALLRATEAHRLSSTALRPLNSTVRLQANRSMALRRASSTVAVLRPRASRTALRVAAALPRKGNNTARRRRLLHRLTTVHQHTRLGPMARRRDLRDRRTEFTRLLFRRSPRPIEIRYDETLRDERRPAEIETSL